MNVEKKLEIAKKSVFKKASQVKGLEIKGPDFNNPQSLKSLIGSYSGIGFQASNLAEAISIIREMRSSKATIYLAYTSGIVSSGLREIVRYLAEHKLVDVLVTTTGGIEEDLIKTMKPFYLGSFNAKGAELREKGINRIGNIFVPNDRYVALEDWINPVLEELYQEQKSGKVLAPSYLIKRFGERINSPESIYYWAAKNEIPVFNPAFLDGSIGDMTYFFKQSHKDFQIDIVSDHKRLIDIGLSSEKTGLIILGAGVIKHSVCNANLFRDGADFAVYINSAQEFDGSDSGASPDEAVSWGKIKGKGARTVKVNADATLVFPLIAAGAFLDSAEGGK